MTKLLIFGIVYMVMIIICIIENKVNKNWNKNEIKKMENYEYKSTS